jgi:E3 ubiquitin-protein ligase RGLG
VLEAYSDVVRRVSLSGPSSLAPIVKKAVDIVRQTRKYHILVIVTDGQITEESASVEAIVDASNVPLSIVAVGVGDGPWNTLQKFDRCIPRRRFDNFRFVDYHRVTAKTKNPDLAFALQALMEIPDQYKRIKELGYLDSRGLLAKRNNSDSSGLAMDVDEGQPASCGAESAKCSPQRVPEEIRHRFNTMSF